MIEAVASVLVVGFRCSKEVLIERAPARGERPPGLERFAFDAVHGDRVGDLVHDREVDTSNGDMASCINTIAPRLDPGAAPSLDTARNR